MGTVGLCVGRQRSTAAMAEICAWPRGHDAGPKVSAAGAHRHDLFTLHFHLKYKLSPSFGSITRLGLDPCVRSKLKKKVKSGPTFH